MTYYITAIFPDEPQLAGFIGAKDDGSGGDWSYKTCKAPVKCHHQQTNTQLFTSDVKRGQNAEEKAKAEAKNLRPRPRLRPEPRGRDFKAKVEASHMM